MGRLIAPPAPVITDTAAARLSSRPTATPPPPRSSTTVGTAESAADERWAALATTMAKPVRRQCPSYLGAHADDIAQAALTKVMAIERGSEGTRELTSFYLHRVAHSALVDEIRRWKRRAEVPLEDVSAGGDFSWTHEPHSSDDPESQAARRELGVAVRGCLTCLSRERRLAVTLHLQGQSVPEVARLLGWDAKRAENLVYRGLGNLRACLIGKGHKP